MNEVGKLPGVARFGPLGVMVNNKLTPSSHIKSVTSKASQRLFMIKRCFTGLTKAKLSTLYSSIIRPVLE